MAETSVTELILSINEMLGSISRIHEDEVTRLKNENALLVAQAKSASGTKAPQRNYTSEESDLSLSPKCPELHIFPEKPMTGMSNSRRCSGSTRAGSSRRGSGSLSISCFMGHSAGNPVSDSQHLGDTITAPQQPNSRLLPGCVMFNGRVQQHCQAISVRPARGAQILTSIRKVLNLWRTSPFYRRRWTT